MFFHIIGRLTDVQTQLLTLNPSVFHFLLLLHPHTIPEAQSKYSWLQNEHRPNHPPPIANGGEWRQQRCMRPKERAPTHNDLVTTNRRPRREHHAPTTKGNNRSSKQVLRFVRSPPLIDLRSQPLSQHKDFEPARNRFNRSGQEPVQQVPLGSPV